MWLLLLLIFLNKNSNGDSIDPIEQILRGVVYTTKDIMQKFLVQIKSPQIVTNSNGGISFQLDPSGSAKTSSFQCLLCAPMDKEKIVGTWNIVLFSRNFLINSLTEINTIIDRLEAGQPISKSKTLSDWLLDPPQIRCPELIILDSAEFSRFELAYSLANGKSKSIIGDWERTMDGSYYWKIGRTLSLQLCVAYPPPQLLNPLNPNGTSTDFLILNQIDSWPSCENFIVLSRSINPLQIGAIRDWLEQQHLEGIFNKLEKVICDQIH